MASAGNFNIECGRQIPGIQLIDGRQEIGCLRLGVELGIEKMVGPSQHLVLPQARVVRGIKWIFGELAFTCFYISEYDSACSYFRGINCALEVRNINSWDHVFPASSPRRFCRSTILLNPEQSNEFSVC